MNNFLTLSSQIFTELTSKDDIKSKPRSLAILFEKNTNDQQYVQALFNLQGLFMFVLGFTEERHVSEYICHLYGIYKENIGSEPPGLRHIVQTKFFKPLQEIYGIDDYPENDNFEPFLQKQEAIDRKEFAKILANLYNSERPGQVVRKAGTWSEISACCHNWSPYIKKLTRNVIDEKKPKEVYTKKLGKLLRQIQLNAECKIDIDMLNFSSLSDFIHQSVYPSMTRLNNSFGSEKQLKFGKSLWDFEIADVTTEVCQIREVDMLDQFKQNSNIPKSLGFDPIIGTKYGTGYRMWLLKHRDNNTSNEVEDVFHVSKKNLEVLFSDWTVAENDTISQKHPDFADGDKQSRQFRLLFKIKQKKGVSVVYSVSKTAGNTNQVEYRQNKSELMILKGYINESELNSLVEAREMTSFIEKHIQNTPRQGVEGESYEEVL